MFQVHWIVKFDIVRVEKKTNYFQLLAVTTAVVKGAEKPLGCVQESGNYLRLLG